MDKPKTISYSAWNAYLTCPKMYEIERVLNYEPIQTSSALIFGSAIDQALNDILVDGDIDKSKDTFKDMIKCLFKTTEHYFFKNDFDFDIMTETQIEIAESYLNELKYSGTLDVETIHKTLFGKIYENGNDYSSITKNQQLFISCISTMSLKQKGLMMIDAYVSNILPQIDEVISVQRPTTKRKGFIDIEVKLKGIGNVTADHKTASRMYTQANVEYSPQLLLYDIEAKNKQIAYFVLGKNVKKNTTKTCKKCEFNGNGLRHKTCPNEINKIRCNGEWDVFISPEIETQILVGDVDDQLQSTVIKSIESVEDAIHKNAFPMNLESCANQFGRPCPYKDYCHKGSAKKMKQKPPRKGK